jgi:hypothetical protein
MTCSPVGRPLHATTYVSEKPLALGCTLAVRLGGVSGLRVGDGGREAVVEDKAGAGCSGCGRSCRRVQPASTEATTTASASAAAGRIRSS